MRSEAIFAARPEHKKISSFEEHMEQPGKTVDARLFRPTPSPDATPQKVCSSRLAFHPISR
jgi:hypothetical protein